MMFGVITTVIGLICSGVLIIPRVAVAEQAPEQTAQDQLVAPSPQQKRLEELRAQLDGTRWSLELTPAEGTGQTRHDTVTFKGQQVSSEWLGKSGFAASNYSLSLSGEMGVWETMQSNDAGDTAAWRGELPGRSMRGAMNKRMAGGGVESFSFVATQLEAPQPPEPSGSPAASETSPATPQDAPQAAQEPAAPLIQQPETSPVSQKPQTAPRRKGWFGR